MGPTDWLLASAAVFCGAVVQGAIGFGVAMVAAPLLYLINPALIPGPMVLTTLVLPLLVLGREWRAVRPMDAAWGVVGQLPGVVLGTAILGVISQSMLSILFGGLVLLAVGLSVIRSADEPGAGTILAASGLFGLMASTTSIGGPPLALALQRWRGARLRGTLSAIFAPGGVTIITSRWLTGAFGAAELWLGLGLMPAVLTGYWLSGHVTHWLDRAWLRPALLGVAAISAVAAIVKGLQ